MLQLPTIKQRAHGRFLFLRRTFSQHFQVRAHNVFHVSIRLAFPFLDFSPSVSATFLIVHLSKMLSPMPRVSLTSLGTTILPLLSTYAPKVASSIAKLLGVLSIVLLFKNTNPFQIEKLHKSCSIYLNHLLKGAF